MNFDELKVNYEQGVYDSDIYVSEFESHNMLVCDSIDAVVYYLGCNYTIATSLVTFVWNKYHNDMDAYFEHLHEIFDYTCVLIDGISDNI